jgi:hypothetical protein
MSMYCGGIYQRRCCSGPVGADGLCDAHRRDALTPTLPMDEWKEMSKKERAVARKLGISPVADEIPEDVREYNRQQSSQYDGPTG